MATSFISFLRTENFVCSSYHALKLLFISLASVWQINQKVIPFIYIFNFTSVRESIHFRMPGPKYVSVVWISDFTVSTISAKHVHNKDMLFNFDIIGPVEYPNGKPKPFPMFPACVFQAASTYTF